MVTEEYIWHSLAYSATVSHVNFTPWIADSKVQTQSSWLMVYIMIVNLDNNMHGHIHCNCI